jgi:hypothetical protein
VEWFGRKSGKAGRTAEFCRRGAVEFRRASEWCGGKLVKRWRGPEKFGRAPKASRFEETVFPALLPGCPVARLPGCAVPSECSQFPHGLRISLIDNGAKKSRIFSEITNRVEKMARKGEPQQRDKPSREAIHSKSLSEKRNLAFLPHPHAHPHRQLWQVF